MFCWQAWGGSFAQKSPFEVPKKLQLFMLKGPRKKTLPSCSLGCQEYEMDNASNFTRGFTPASNPKRGNKIWAIKWAFIYVKRVNAKNSVISYLRVLRVRNGQCKQFHARLYPCQQPRKGYRHYAQRNGLLFMLKGSRLKNSVISYLRVPRVRNGQCKQFHARLYPCQQPRKG